MVLVRNDMTYRIRDDLMNNEIQTIWVELIRKNSKNIVIGGVYRTWSDNQDDDAETILIACSCAKTNTKTNAKTNRLVMGIKTS